MKEMLEKLLHEKVFVLYTDQEKTCQATGVVIGVSENFLCLKTDYNEIFLNFSQILKVKRRLNGESNEDRTENIE